MLEVLGAQLGEVKVYVGKPGRGHGDEFWAERAAERIIEVANSAPDPIRQQALAFREKIQYVILGAVKSAVAERKARDATLADLVSPELAAQIRGDE